MTNCTILFESDHDEIQMAGERGIYSLLDMHQDAFNRLEIPYLQFLTTFVRKYCGNGVPDWAAKPNKENFPYPLEVQQNVHWLGVQQNTGDTTLEYQILYKNNQNGEIVLFQVQYDVDENGHPSR